jgi:uncharacterized protein (DUF305 family)
MAGTSARIVRIALASAVWVASGACQHASSDQNNTSAKTNAQPAAVQPGAPGTDSAIVDRATVSVPPHTPADTNFMQGMIHHHAQAIAMVKLLDANTDTPTMRLLGQRIRISQNDEIKMMKNWLTERHEAVPTEQPDGSMTMAMRGMPDMQMPMAMMPGMLTTAQMATLGKAKGKAFDKLFLEGMIQHHGGALVMVQDLFASPGAGEDSVVFDFASHVDADQRMEISRMRKMLEEMK